MTALMHPVGKLSDSCELFFGENLQAYFSSNLLVTLWFWGYCDSAECPSNKEYKLSPAVNKVPIEESLKIAEVFLTALTTR